MLSKRIGYAALVAALLVTCFACGKKQATPLELGMQSFDAADYDAAKMHFETVLATEPDNAQGQYYLGRIALQSGDVKEAVSRLEKAAELDQANSEYHFRLGVAYAQQIQRVSFMEQGQIAPKLKGAFEKAVEADGENLDARMALAQYYMNAPPIVGGSPEKAKEQIEFVKTREPRRAHVMLGQMHAARQEYDEAEREFKAAQAIAPDDTDLHYHLALLYQQKQDYASAFTVLEEALAIDPSYGRALYQMGRTAVFAGDNMERGVECLKTYLGNAPVEGEPTWAHAHWRLGALYEKMGQTDKAKRHYEAALELDPELNDAKEALERL